jgi:hypothetical protein
VSPRRDDPAGLLLEAYDHKQPPAGADSAALVPAPPRAGVRLGVVPLRHGPEHVLEVRPQLRMVFDDLVLPDPLGQHHGPALGIGELSEQMLIGGHAARLINAPDDHPIGEASCPPSNPVAADGRRSPATLPGFDTTAPH